MDSFNIDPLLAYSQHSADAAPVPGQFKWDLRQSSESARRINPDQDITFADLARPATQPPLGSLDITCGIFPGDWPIKIRRPEGITVSDVLEGIRKALLQRISHAEYAAYPENQKQRIAAVFNSRWLAAPDPATCRQNGVLRLDCLLYHTMFAGLSVSLDNPRSCILTLRRQPDHRRTPSAESQPPRN